MSGLYKVLSREPVILGKALVATLTIPVQLSGLDDATKALILGAVLLWVGWGERLFSTSESKAKERVEAAETKGYDAAVSDVNALAAVPPPPVAAPLEIPGAGPEPFVPQPAPAYPPQPPL